MKIEEKFPGDEHRQIYYLWREYPLGAKLTLIMGVFIGVPLGLVPFVCHVVLK